MSDTNSEMAPKTVAIISHITIIGTIVAIVLNNQNKSDFASFYIRQNLGIGIISLLTYIIPIVGMIIGIICLVAWILSLIGAINDKKEPTPFVGDFFQDIFKSI